MVASGVKDYLVAQSVGTFGTNLFVSQLPDSPDNVICIFDEPGTVLAEHRDRDSDSFGTQIMVRGSYSFCNSKIREIHRAMPMLSGEYDSIRIIDTYIQTEPGYIETDDKGRRVYSAHYEHYCNLGNSVNRTSNYTP